MIDTFKGSGLKLKLDSDKNIQYGKPLILPDLTVYHWDSMCGNTHYRGFDYLDDRLREYIAEKKMLPEYIALKSSSIKTA